MLNEKSKKIELRFIDSFKFMSSSLDLLVNNLAKGGHELWGFEKRSPKQKDLLIEKKSIIVNTWIVGISLKKSNYQARMSFIAS